MRTITTMAIVSLLSIAATMTGCIDINADASDLGGPSARQPAPADQPAPQVTPERLAQIPRENVRLRQTRAKLEQDRQNWQAAIDRLEDEIDDLKDQRKRLEKQRDRAKDALED